MFIRIAAAVSAPAAAAERLEPRVARYQAPAIGATPNCSVLGSSPSSAGVPDSSANVTPANAPAARPA